ncbi:MAG: (2Fe-2S)-binding protein [Alphaproteobacteria bacterium]|nr:(2Fe-2S)-binding protein [Alphaproteobacteria bacterium]
MSAWKKVCRMSEIEINGIKEFDIDGHKIAVVRTADTVFAMPLRCPHMEEPLSTGMCDGETLTCSFHLWQWNLKTGQSTGEAEIDLLKYPVKLENAEIYVDLAQILSYS